MDVFKRTKKNTDERIENIRNKIFKEMYYVVMTICLISIFFKMYKFGIGESALMEEAILELVILIVGGVYFLARSIFLGVFWDEVEIHDRTSKTPMSKKTIFRSVGLAFLIAITMGINSAVSYADSTTQGFWYFIQVLLASLMIYLPILLILFGGIYMLAKKISMTSRKS